MATYQSSNSSDPTSPTASGSAGNDTSVAASEGLNIASLSLDSNSGCVKLTPLLSWNYCSTLSEDSFWYERGKSQQASDQGTLPKGNDYISVNLPVGAVASANVSGEPVAVTPATGDVDTSSPQHVVLVNQVYGLAADKTYRNSFVDNESADAQNQSHNVFQPTQEDNAWKEVQTTEFATLNTTKNTPSCLIRTNFSFFKAGQNPANIADNPGSVNANQNANLATEYIITSDFDLPENSSFAITYHTYFYNKTEGDTADTQGKSYFRVYWGTKYLFQFNGEEASFCADTTGSPEDWTMHPISGLRLTTKNQKELITLVFEVVGTYITISNADVGDSDKRDKRPSWGYQDLKDPNNFDPNAPFGIVIPEGPIVIGVRAMDIAWSYIPVVYPTEGTMSVANEETGYSINNLAVSGQVDTTEIMGGMVNVVANIQDADLGTFGYDITVSREDTPDKSPAVFSISLKADPTYTSIGIRSFDTTNKVRKVEAALGLESQAGSFTLDDRDGIFASVGGIIPAQVYAGWAGGTSSVAPQLLFSGFCTTQVTTKSSTHSEATMQMVGADLILKDAIAINLPIYDGFDDGEAVRDLLMRGGWSGNGPANVQGGFQLPVPGGLNPEPLFKFPLGKPIMDCIREIATNAGAWAFVDNFGTFNYMQMNQGYGNFIGSYNEVPNVAAYDEWQTLSGVKNSTDTRNAVLVVGVKLLTDDIPIIVAAIRTDDAGTIGDYLGTTNIPWLRWYVLQDPKINEEAAAAAIAERLFQINNRIRVSISGTLWGHPKIVPWAKLAVTLQTEDIGIPGGSQWRILNALHTLDADTGNYTTIVECEYVDPRYIYTSWWE